MPSRASQPIPTVFLALLLCVGGSTTSANAQVVSVSGISGLVSDATGAVITEASVVVKNSDTGGTWNTTTNDSGVYNFPVLPPGTYTITVSRTGFKSAVVSNRTIQVAQPAHVDVVLPIGEISERVTVSAEGNELLTTATAEIATTVTPTLVKNLPVSRRNFLDLTTVTPGVISQTLAAYGGGPGISQAASSLNYVQAAGTVMQSSVFIAGNRDSANNISVDGGNIQSALYQDTMQLQSPASIQELKVETANMSAEFGNGVAAINVITKSGTNEYHGELYEYFRNNKLDANGFFNNLAGRALPHYSQNQFGAAAGGPIKKDKLLVFGNYEGLRVRHDSVSIQTVPPSDVRLGDFSNYLPPRPGLPNQFLPTPTIYNPYQFDSRTGLRQPFPGNKIPMGPTNLCAPRPTCIDPVAAALLKDWVLQPNTVIDGIPRLVGNTRSTINADQMTFRVDWLKSSSTTIYGRYTRAPVDALNVGLQPLEGTYSPYSSQNAVIHWTQTLKPTVINNLMVGYSRPKYFQGRRTGVPDVSQQIGLTNTSGNPGGPFMGGTEFAMGFSGSYIVDATTDMYQFKDDLTTFRGRHSFKVGFESNERRLRYPYNFVDKGYFIVGNNFTRACPAGSTVCDGARAATGLDVGGMGFADFLLGGWTQAQRILTSAAYRGYQRYYGGYFQDSWRATPRFTVNYGLRYEYWSPWLVPRNTTVAFDFDTAQIKYPLQNPLDYLEPSKCMGACAPLNSDIPRAGYTRGKKNFAPRLGLGYQLTNSTTMRVSAGMYFDGNQNDNQWSDIQSGAAPFKLRYDNYVDPSQQTILNRFSDNFPAPTASGVPQPNTDPPSGFRFPMPEYKVATVYQWAFSIQQRLSSVWGMELNYLGSHTIRSFQYMDMNSPALPQGPLANLSLQQRRRWPQWGSLQTWAPLGWGRYNGFIAGIKNNTWHGLTLLANYTWAKNIVSSHWGFSDIGNIDYRNIYIWAGPYMSTPYHRFVAGYSYALPLGRGKALVNSAPSVVDLLVSGWTFSGITTFSLGAPQAVQGRDLSGTANVGMPDRICDPTKGYTKSRLMWFNTACFVDSQYGVYGNSPLGVINLPGINNWDLTLSKFTKTNFPKETGQVEFRAELFNAFNHTQWGGPSQTTTSATFGQISGTRPPRQVQLALRYIF